MRRRLIGAAGLVALLLSAVLIRHLFFSPPDASTAAVPAADEVTQAAPTAVADTTEPDAVVVPQQDGSDASGDDDSEYVVDQVGGHRSPGLDELVARAKAPLSEQEKEMLELRGTLCNSERSLQVLLRDQRVIHFRNAIIDTTVIDAGGSDVDIPEHLRASKDTTHFVVQFSAAASPELEAQLSALGAVVEQYVPNSAYVITASPEVMVQVRAMDTVRYVSPYHPYFRMNTPVMAHLQNDADATEQALIERGRFNILAFAESTPADIEALGATVLRARTVAGKPLMEIECGSDVLASLVRSEAVRWVEAVPQMTVMNDLGDHSIGSQAAKFVYPGLDGSGVIVGIADTGIDFTHPGFAIDPSLPTSTNSNTRIVRYVHLPSGSSDGDPGDAGGHGSHVAGSVLGNGAASQSVIAAPGSGDAPYSTNEFAGIAPGARVVMVEDFNSFTYQEIVSIPYQNGARLANNSWGANWPWYETPSMEWDELVRDADPILSGRQEYIAFFAAGNSGGGPSDGLGGVSPSVGMPGNAKNVITVGATEQLRHVSNLAPYGSLLDTDTGWQVAGFSSRGPTPDFRMKPDIVAPGHWVISVQSADAPDSDYIEWPEGITRDFAAGNLDTGPRYAANSGTSMATPLTTGAGALLYQWYNGRFGSPPSPSMMKTMMVGGAQRLNSVMYPMDVYGPAVCYQGWGMVDIARTIDGNQAYDTDVVLLFDQEQSVNGTGEKVSRTFRVDSDDSGGLKVVIAWSDAPGDPTAGIVQVNDLDLVVTAPDGTKYMGNWMGRRVWGSASYEITPTEFALNYLPFDPLMNPTKGVLGDPFNNTEVVMIRDAVKGEYTIEVYGWIVPEPSQDFSMMIMLGESSLGDSGGADPDMAIDENGFPVMVTTVSSTGGADFDLIGVRRWSGSFGDSLDIGSWQALRGKWDDYGDEWSAEIISGAAPGSVAADPSIEVNPANGNAYVAWQYQSFDTNVPHSIYLRYWDSTERDWLNLGNSYKWRGLSTVGTLESSMPTVGIAADGQPIVSFLQNHAFGSVLPVVKKWNPATETWRGLDGSVTGLIIAEPAFPSFIQYANVDMVTDAAGNPWVLCQRLYPNTMTTPLQVYRWNGSAWQKVGSDFAAYSTERPRLTLDNASRPCVVWVSIPNVGNGEYTDIVRVYRFNGGSWQPVAEAGNPGGISGLEGGKPYNPQIDFADGELFVAWQSGNTVTNSVFMKKWTGAGNWIGEGNSDTKTIYNLGGTATLTAMAVSPNGDPAMAIENNRTGLLGSDAVGLVGPVASPPFLGLITATGTSSNTVDLLWSQPFAPGQIITYHIYQSSISWDPADTNRPDQFDPGVIANVFANEITTVNDVSTYTVTGLADDRVWYWAVRAENSAGMDSNEELRLGGPYSLTGDADADWLPTNEELRLGSDPVNPDSDGDLMWDGWEWFYSADNNDIDSLLAGIPRHTNAVLAMAVLDNGVDDLTTTNVMDGTANTGPYDDLDEDGLLNVEEFQWWYDFVRGTNSYNILIVTNRANWLPDPTDPDSDDDGMEDGWEVINGLDPLVPADPLDDTDGDGLLDTNEYVWGSNPTDPDSDSDGLPDGFEVTNTFTYPTLADSDGDGLDDGMEFYDVNGNPTDADSNDNDLDDGDEYQIGYTNVSHTNDIVFFLPDINGNRLVEDCETPSYAQWIVATNSTLWHRTLTDPDPPGTGFGFGQVGLLYDHSTNKAFRFAVDVPDGTNLNATYDLDGAFPEGALISPPFNPDSNGVLNLYVSWKELHETEPAWDVCEVSATRDNGVNWIIVGQSSSGDTDGWRYRVADLSDFAYDSQVRVRFLFRAKNNINNHFRGWWVDDIKIYAGGAVKGTVRDVNGQPIKGATVYAIGSGNVTNTVGGHQYVYPSQIYRYAVSDVRGDYEIHGLWYGDYYVKATAPGFRSEFWDGPLFTNAIYADSFGTASDPGTYPGVLNLSDVDPATGLVSPMATNYFTSHFELEPGANGGRLGVSFPARPSDVYLDEYVNPVQIWDGVVNAPGADEDHLVNYSTTNDINNILSPNYDTNPQQSTLVDDVASGQHEVTLHPGWPTMPYVPRISIPVRDGEVTRVFVGTNRPNSYIYVRADLPDFEVVINGRPTGELTVRGGRPTVFPVPAGEYAVSLISPTNGIVAPKIVHPVTAGRANVLFSSFDLNGPEGWALIDAVDIKGNAISNGMVYINGEPLQASDVVSGVIGELPILVENLHYGTHYLTVREPGYRLTQSYPLGIFNATTTEVTLRLSEGDRDYDAVGDKLEIEGYTNFFMYSGIDDPDNDGVNSALEYEQFRLHNVRMGIFNPDTDGDGLIDGRELGWDGNTNSYGLSRLYADTSLELGYIDVVFVGKFLEGISGLPITIPAAGVRLSIEGDEVKGTSLSWETDTESDAPLLRYYLPLSGPSDQVLGSSYIKDTAVYSDTYPTDVDSDSDGLWDGWEFMWGPRTVGLLHTNIFTDSPAFITFEDVGLDPLDAALQEDDPDYDGLVNRDEFLGFNGVPDMDDYTRPDDADTEDDGMPDGWELEYDLNPRVDDSTDDPDGDTLVNEDEYQNGTNPQDEDTDTDLITDGDEVHEYGSNPTLLDTDLDGLFDGWEVIDSDGDASNGEDGGFFPHWIRGGLNDMDNDELWDGPQDWDTDGDGMPDGFEVLDAQGYFRDPGSRLDPSDPNDGILDYDGDGLSNYEEWLVRDGRLATGPWTFLPQTPVFGVTSGVVIVEIESAPNYTNYWYGFWRQDYVPATYTGTELYTFSNEFGIAWTFEPYDWMPRMEYYIDVESAGYYHFEIRHTHADADPTLENGVWVRVDEAMWRLTTSSNNVPGAWTYDTWQSTNAYVTNASGFIISIQQEIVPGQNRYYFNRGLHQIEIAGLDIGYSADRFHFYKDSVVTPPDETAPESTITGYANDPAVNGIVWDYPADPFNPDSDGDGMPDGFEALYGLHPMDPLPWAGLRYWDFWLFADLDNDGVENINEYTYRFVLDPDANPNAVAGSLHPWFPDTDGDGLLDGEEFKGMLSLPLKQDSDGDGLMDGQGITGLVSETYTSIDTSAPEHYDRALNDIWAVGTPPGMYTYWGMVNPDGDVTYADPVLEAANYIVGEIEQTTYTNYNEGVAGARNYIIPPVWTNEHDALAVPMPMPVVSNYLEYTGSAEVNPDNMMNLLTYKFDVASAAPYKIAVRTRFSWWQDHFGTDFDDIYPANSFWVKIDTGGWMLMVSESAESGADTGMWDGVWTYRTRRIVGITGSDPYGYEVDPIIPLTAGTHTLQISGRGYYGMNFDRWVLYREGADPTTAGAPTYGPYVALGPQRRWGAAGEQTGYKIEDQAVAGIRNAKDVYVGGTVSKFAIPKQTLMSCNVATVFGGQNGPNRFSDIWELRSASTWDLFDAYALPMGGVAGDTDLLVAQYRSVNNSTAGGIAGGRPVGRPRPGTVPAYRYYGGIDYVLGDPIEIWGEDGAVNNNMFVFIAGWDQSKAYYPLPRQQHDYVESYGGSLTPYFPTYYVAGDDNNQIVYRWEPDTWSFQTNSATPPEDPNAAMYGGNVVIGSWGTNELYTGFNIGAVLNTALDFTGNGSFVARLMLAASVAVTQAFDVAVIGELYYEENGQSVENIAPHAVLLSDPDYTTDTYQWPANREAIDTIGFGGVVIPSRYWNTTTNIVTIPVMNAGETLTIDVTPLLEEMLSAQLVLNDTRAIWELGNNMGFLFKGITNGLAFVRPDLTLLELTTAEPPWKYASQIVSPLMIVTKPYQRKSSAIAYEAAVGGYVIFGGIDGNRVLDDTWLSADGLDWEIRYPAQKPPARWGHGMVAIAGYTVIFGGFDSRNQPLDDTWVWDGNTWHEASFIMNAGMEFVPDRPNPRGGAAFGTLSGWGLLFGGTDGKQYFNDTWILVNVSGPTIWQWILTEPHGEYGTASPRPAARAWPTVWNSFNNKNLMGLFGGRTGTLPTAADSDSDWIHDGRELDLGGSTLGRDPRVNALWAPTAVNNPYPEMIPYTFYMLGGLVNLGSGYDRFTAICDFEALDEPIGLSLTMMQGLGRYPVEGDGGYYTTRVDASDWWWSKFAGASGTWDDPRNEWELGTPEPTGSNTAPSQAASGRWCMGTDLNGKYDNNAVMELYTPLLELEIPNPSSTDQTNSNAWWLVFNEWLDLADTSDRVYIHAIRPESQADLLTRVPGPNTDDVIPIMAPRNNQHNTTGKWRRVWLPLTVQEDGLFFKFVLQSDTNGVAGGWYIDDVAILQAGRIDGVHYGTGNIYLYGVNGTNHISVIDSDGGAFTFNPLPTGYYRVEDDTGAVTPFSLTSGSWLVTVPAFVSAPSMASIEAPALAATEVGFASIPGATYEIQYQTHAGLIADAPWLSLTNFTATGTYETRTDTTVGTDKVRYYRVVLLSVP